MQKHLFYHNKHESFIYDDDGVLVGMLKRNLSKIQQLFFSFKKNIHLACEMENKEKNIRLIAKMPFNEDYLREINYTKMKNSEIVHVYHQSWNKANFESFYFKYQNKMYYVNQENPDEAKIYLGKTWVATWSNNNSGIHFYFSEEFNEDIYLWLMIFHACYGNFRKFSSVI